MTEQLHVVLGASGVVGHAVIKELTKRGIPFRAVGRSKPIDGVEVVTADLLDLDQTRRAVKGATHVYLCVGLRYEASVWQEEWPLVMQNVLTACEEADARLVFLDNVYMYGPTLSIPFNEKEPQHPSSEKGKVRKHIANLLLQAHQDGKVKALIGRSADFYGPNVRDSVLYISFLERMLAGKSPQAIGQFHVQHTFAHVDDNGRALVALALDESCYGQVWHLPVSEPATMQDITRHFNELLGTDYRISKIPRPVLVVMGLFVRPVKEIREMLYQFDLPYLMDSSKFTAHFPDFETTRLEDGLREMVESFRP